uniref:Putative secreted protein n=1 Tax=Xenopsylla cheopis TaxID=163159 RepID=A0A6M2DXL3_XENCH
MQLRMKIKMIPMRIGVLFVWMVENSCAVINVQKFFIKIVIFHLYRLYQMKVKHGNVCYVSILLIREWRIQLMEMFFPIN